MKTRSALQIIIGVLSLLVAAGLFVTAVAIVFLLYANPALFETQITVANTISLGLRHVGTAMGLTVRPATIVSAIFYGVPFVLLLTAAILMFLRKANKQAQYVAASVLALAGATILTVFNIVCATSLLGGDLVVSYKPEILQKMIDSNLYVRIAFGGLLALFTLFVGLALGLKPKREKVPNETVETEAEQSTVETWQQPTTVEEQVEEQDEVQPDVTADANVEQNPAMEYVPNTDVTVNDIMHNTYGDVDEELDTESVTKIKKLRSLLEINAISREEYLKLVNIYIGKKQ